MVTTEVTAGHTGPGGATADAGSDPFRAALHHMWSAAAPGWERHAAYVDERGAAVTAALLARSAVAEGGTVIDLACGPGGVALAAADRVGPTGRVVAGDIAPEMVAIAAARAAAAGHDHLTARRLDLEALDVSDASVDAVVCREGLMLVPEPARALAEIGRVLRPGGRVAVAVWGPRADNPWVAALLDAVAGHLGVEVPPPGIPGPFSLDDAEVLERLFLGAGLVDVTVDEVGEPLSAPSFDAWWGVVPELAGPVAGILAGMAEADRSAVRDRARHLLDPYRTPSGGYELPGVSLVAAGARR
jgi:SAM-dependent methyltransferase